MAKNFPFFKFIATEWLTGDIVYEDFNIQGFFINICALYWQRDGELTIDEINKRYKDPELLSKLTDRFFSVSDGFISIKFLDEQLIEANHISKVNTENGKKGGRPKVLKTKEEKPNANRTLTEQEPNDNQRRIKEEEKKNINLFGDFIQLFFKHLNKKFKSKKELPNFLARLKDGFTIEQFEQAIENIKNDPYHIETGYKHITPEFVCRIDKLEKFINASSGTSKKELVNYDFNNLYKTD